jgi:hypothetical protein
MEKFIRKEGLVAPLDRANVDTDAIIPKQFLKSIKRTGFGPNLFDEWRYLDRGEPDADNAKRPLNPDFVLNQKRYQGATVLLARENFGCGSSREHAPWALLHGRSPVQGGRHHRGLPAGGGPGGAKCYDARRREFPLRDRPVSQALHHERARRHRAYAPARGQNPCV